MITNPLVDFLASYGPKASAANQYDELIDKTNKPINIEQKLIHEIEIGINKEPPQSVILTGTAGDGKTYTARKFLERISGGKAVWSRDEHIVTHSYKGDEICFIKDLSELDDDEKDNLFPLIHASLSGNSNTIFVICANDGNLLRYFREREKKDEAGKMKFHDEIEQNLSKKVWDSSNNEFRVINMSRVNNADVLDKIIDEIVNHPDWKKCAGCPAERSASHPCPILENANRLGKSDEPAIRYRLADMIRLASLDGKHLSIRQLIMLAVNIILGDSGGESSTPLLTCESALKRSEKSEYQFTNPYANAFGANIPEHQRKRYKAFSILESFNVGKESNDFYDKNIIQKDSTLPDDPIYGNRIFDSHRSRYLIGEGGDSDDFLRSMIDQRIRLFFSMPVEKVSDESTRHKCPWNLTKYRYGELHCRLARRKHENEVESDISVIRGSIILGLNKVMSGFMTRTNNCLWVVKPSGVFGGQEVPLSIVKAGREKDERVIIRFNYPNKSNPVHSISVVLKSHRKPVTLSLGPTLTECILRVSNGVLPSSVSPSCQRRIEKFQLEVVSAMREFQDEYADPGQLEMETSKWQLVSHPIPALSNQEEW